jgi:hypothetical protein
MNKNQLTRLERLEQTAGRWQVDNAIREAFWMDNKTVTVNTWTQKRGLVRGEPIEFETVRDALQWAMGACPRGQVFLDDVRDVMSDEERMTFDALFPNAPNYKIMFDLRYGQNVFSEAVRMFKHCLSGVAHLEWWEETNAHIDGLLQSIE